MKESTKTQIWLIISGVLLNLIAFLYGYEYAKEPKTTIFFFMPLIAMIFALYQWVKMLFVYQELLEMKK